MSSQSVAKFQRDNPQPQYQCRLSSVSHHHPSQPTTLIFHPPRPLPPSPQQLHTKQPHRPYKHSRFRSRSGYISITITIIAVSVAGMSISKSRSWFDCQVQLYRRSCRIWIWEVVEQFVKGALDMAGRLDGDAFDFLILDGRFGEGGGLVVE